jgi:hypothetical protein
MGRFTKYISDAILANKKSATVSVLKGNTEIVVDAKKALEQLHLPVFFREAFWKNVHPKTDFQVKATIVEDVPQEIIEEFIQMVNPEEEVEEVETKKKKKDKTTEQEYES